MAELDAAPKPGANTPNSANSESPALPQLPSILPLAIASSSLSLPSIRGFGKVREQLGYRPYMLILLKDRENGAIGYRLAKVVKGSEKGDQYLSDLEQSDTIYRETEVNRPQLQSQIKVGLLRLEQQLRRESEGSIPNISSAKNLGTSASPGQKCSLYCHSEQQLIATFEDQKKSEVLGVIPLDLEINGQQFDTSSLHPEQRLSKEDVQKLIWTLNPSSEEQRLIELLHLSCKQEWKDVQLQIIARLPIDRWSMKQYTPGPIPTTLYPLLSSEAQKKAYYKLSWPENPEKQMNLMCMEYRYVHDHTKDPEFREWLREQQDNLKYAEENQIDAGIKTAPEFLRISPPRPLEHQKGVSGSTAYHRIEQLKHHCYELAVVKYPYTSDYGFVVANFMEDPKQAGKYIVQHIITPEMTEDREDLKLLFQTAARMVWNSQNAHHSNQPRLRHFDFNETYPQEDSVRIGYRGRTMIELGIARDCTVLGVIELPNIELLYYSWLEDRAKLLNIDSEQDLAIKILRLARGDQYIQSDILYRLGDSKLPLNVYPELVPELQRDTWEKQRYERIDENNRIRLDYLSRHTKDPKAQREISILLTRATEIDDARRKENEPSMLEKLDQEVANSVSRVKERAAEEVRETVAEVAQDARDSLIQWAARKTRTTIYSLLGF